MIGKIPPCEMPDALFQRNAGPEPDFLLQFGRIGPRARHVARLHGLHIEFGLAAERCFECPDKCHQRHGTPAADVVNLGRNASRRHFVQQADDGIHDVVHIGEVALHISAVENTDGFSGKNRPRKKHRRHVGTSPRPVDREETQSRERNSVDPGINLRDQFVAALGRGIERNGGIHDVFLGKRNLGIASVDRTRRSVEHMPHGVAAAALQQTDESEDVAFDIDIGIFKRIAYAGLCREVDSDIEPFCGEQLFERRAIFEPESPEPERREDFGRESPPRPGRDPSPQCRVVRAEPA